MPHADFKDNMATHLLTCLSTNIYGDAGMFQIWQQEIRPENDGKELRERADELRRQIEKRLAEQHAFSDCIRDQARSSSFHF